MIKALILSSIFFVIFLFFHIFLFKSQNIKNRFSTMVKVSAVLLLFYSAAYLCIDESQMRVLLPQIFSPRIITFFSLGFLYFSICFMYYNHVVFAYRSISGRIMVEINCHPQKKMNLESIKSSYSIDKKIESEIEDMVCIHRMRVENGVVKNTSQGRQHAQLIKKCKQILNLKDMH